MSTIDLRGPDGNIFVVFGEVSRIMRKYGNSKEEIKEYIDELMSMKYDDIINKIEEDWDEIKFIR